MGKKARLVFLRPGALNLDYEQLENAALNEDGLLQARALADRCSELAAERNWGTVRLVHAQNLRTTQVIYMFRRLFPGHKPGRAAWPQNRVNLRKLVLEHPWDEIDTLIVCGHLPAITSLLAQAKAKGFPNLGRDVITEFLLDFDNFTVEHVGSVN